MIRREELVKKFAMGISVLDAYIHYTGYLNMHDINVTSEQFLCDILNILHNLNLENANNRYRNNPGYDLIDTTNKIIVQVTSTSSPDKIIDTLCMLTKRINEREEWTEQLKKIKCDKEKDSTSYTLSVQEEERELKASITKSPDLRGYKLLFMIMVRSADEQRKYKGKSNVGYVCPKGIIFEATDNIIDFDFLINKVNSLAESTSDAIIMDRLEKFMSSNYELFGGDVDLQKNQSQKINSIVLSYKNNFTQKLFRHRYEKNSSVTLENLFVNPKVKTSDGESRNIIKILADFLWNEEKNRILFIEGDAAIGKTSLISFLCYHYIQEDEIRKAIFLQCDLICIRLRELDFAEKSIEDALLKYFEIKSIDSLKKQYKNCVMILDGADEMRMLEGASGVKIESIIVAFRKIFSDNKIIITSRPQFIDIKSLENRNFGYERIELLHFDREMRQQWLVNYQKCDGYIPQKTQDYILNIDDKSAAGVADTPLALYLLVACEIREELQGNPWALYHEIFKKLIINTDYNENFEDIIEHPIKKNEAILYKIVCGIAYKMFQNVKQERYYITSEELNTVMLAAEVMSDQFEVVKRCCVLCAYWKKCSDVGVLEFYHNNIRDYFFAEYLYDYIEKWFIQNKKVGIESFVQYICEVLSYGYIYGTTWEQTMMFLYNKLKFLKEQKENQMIIEDELKMFKLLFTECVWGMQPVWQHEFDGYTYQTRKNIIVNLLLIARIYQVGYEVDQVTEKNLFWRSEEEKVQMISSNILIDWPEIFSAKIDLKNRWVTIGQNCILDYMDFQKKWIENTSFDKSSFFETNFEGATLKGVSLCNTNLTGVVFANATLKGIDFTNAILEDTVFDYAIVEECIFDGAKIKSGTFEKTRITDCSFQRTSVIGVNWLTANVTKVSIEDSSFKNSVLQGMKFLSGKIYGNKFSECDLQKMNIQNCTLRDTQFENCTLDMSIFTNAALVNVSLNRVTCLKCKMNNATIENCSFMNANFEDTTFAQSIIQKNYWNKIKMRNADFRKARISSNDYTKIEREHGLVAWAIKESD